MNDETKTRFVQLNENLWVNPAQVGVVYIDHTGVVVDLIQGATFRVNQKLSVVDVVMILDDSSTYTGRVGFNNDPT